MTALIEADAPGAAPEVIPGIGVRGALAALSLAAGVIHLAMVPAHMGQWALEGIAFAVIGWLQVLLAVALLMRPTRGQLVGSALLNGAVVIGYVVSRTSGLPFGPNSGVAEQAGAIDLLATGFEVLVVLGCIVLLLRPTFLGDLSIEGLGLIAVIPVLALIATTAALADPATATHSHGDAETATGAAGGHAHGGTAATGAAELTAIASGRCDLGLNPAAYWSEATVAGIDTITGGESESHDHNATAKVKGSADLDRLISKQTTGTGEGGDAAMVLALGAVSDDVYSDWLRWLAASGSASHSHATATTATAAAPDDNHGMGGHLGAQPWHAMTDRARCDQLTSELALARDTALKYPTVADAKQAGWVQVTGYVPGIAAHFMNFELVDDTFAIDEPEMLLYDGTSDEANVVGLSYYLLHPGSAEPTQGFTGNNDHFHRHDGLCVGPGGVIGDSTTTAESCAAKGGRKANGQAGWMSHAWVVPGCESPWGVFSGASPLLEAQLGKSSGTDSGACAGSGVRSRYDLNPGQVDNTPTTVGGSVQLASGN